MLKIEVLDVPSANPREPKVLAQVSVSGNNIDKPENLPEYLAESLEMAKQGVFKDVGLKNCEDYLRRQTLAMGNIMILAVGGGKAIREFAWMD